MRKSELAWFSLVVGVTAFVYFYFGTNAFAFGFETKMQNLTSQLIGTVLPLLSVLALVYAVILAFAGDGAAKARIVMVLVMAIIGFLAPSIISWLQRASGSGYGP